MFSYTYCLLFGWQVVNVNVKMYYLQLKLVYKDLSLIHWNIHFFDSVFLDGSSQKVAKMYP